MLGYSVAYPTAFLIQLEGWGGSDPYANDDVELVGHPLGGRRYSHLEIKALNEPIEISEAYLEEADITSKAQRDFGTLYVAATVDREHDERYSFRITNIIWGDKNDLGQIVITLKTSFDQNNQEDSAQDKLHHEYLKNIVLNSFTVNPEQFFKIMDVERND